MNDDTVRQRLYLIASDGCPRPVNVTEGAYAEMRERAPVIVEGAIRKHRCKRLEVVWIYFELKVPYQLAPLMKQNAEVQRFIREIVPFMPDGLQVSMN